MWRPFELTCIEFLFIKIFSAHKNIDIFLASNVDATSFVVWDRDQTARAIRYLLYFVVHAKALLKPRPHWRPTSRRNRRHSGDYSRQCGRGFMALYDALYRARAV